MPQKVDILKTHRIRYGITFEFYLMKFSQDKVNVNVVLYDGNLDKLFNKITLH